MFIHTYRVPRTLAGILLTQMHAYRHIVLAAMVRALFGFYVMVRLLYGSRPAKKNENYPLLEPHLYVKAAQDFDHSSFTDTTRRLQTC